MPPIDSTLAFMTKRYFHTEAMFVTPRTDIGLTIRYDNPVGGHKEWRQRNVTVVGGGHSLCAISYAPVPLWKKSKETRALLDAILASVTFR